MSRGVNYRSVADLQRVFESYVRLSHSILLGHVYDQLRSEFFSEHLRICDVISVCEKDKFRHTLLFDEVQILF